MLKAQIYTLKGSKIGELTLPKDIFEQKINLKLLAQANHVYEDRSHVGLRSAKTRAEINRTTKKVYKQKGTGGARHGSRRANVFVGGGVVFGPRPVRRILEMSQALRRAAVLSAFSAKAKEQKIVALRGVSGLTKTKEAGEFLEKLSKEVKAKRFTFLMSEGNLKSFRFLRNLKNVTTVLYKNASAFDIFKGGQLVLDESVFEVKKAVSKVEAKK
ncbi:MAG TPA: 50S ribosomal protein L4 [Patescibacteria group bacterium]|nr:50S ribosomal protein L4 [Patescibacteria group bacterium]